MGHLLVMTPVRGKIPGSPGLTRRGVTSRGGTAPLGTPGGCRAGADPRSMLPGRWPCECRGPCASASVCRGRCMALESSTLGSASQLPAEKPWTSDSSFRPLPLTSTENAAIGVNAWSCSEG